MEKKWWCCCHRCTPAGPFFPFSPLFTLGDWAEKIESDFFLIGFSQWGALGGIQRGNRDSVGIYSLDFLPEWSAQACWATSLKVTALLHELMKWTWLLLSGSPETRTIGMYCMHIYMYYIYICILYIYEWEKREKDFKELAHMMWRLVSLRSAGRWASWTPNEALMLHPHIWRPSGDRFPSSSQDGHLFT